MCTSPSETPTLQISPHGVILGFNHQSIPGGDQIQTTIVFKGRPLTLPWDDSSPKHATTARELEWSEDECLFCQTCSLICHKGCLTMTDEGMQIDTDKCDLCGKCVKECPSGAMKLIGLRTTAKDLLHQILKQNYHIAHKIKTISLAGGEPAQQPQFAVDLLSQLRAEGISTHLYTFGLSPFDDLEGMLSFPERIYYHLITLDSCQHEEITGCLNDTILSNLDRTANWFQTNRHPSQSLIIRTPLISGLTAFWTNLEKIAAHLFPDFSEIIRSWELVEPKTLSPGSAHLSVGELAQIKAHLSGLGLPSNRVSIYTQGNILRPIP